MPADNQLYIDYHDHEWGRFNDDDRHHFEMLVLEGAQAGLNWLTILKKRGGYRELFHNFDPQAVATMSDSELEACLQSSKIVRNRLKVYAARQNARAYLRLLEQHGSYLAFVEAQVGYRHKNNHRRDASEVPAQDADSAQISKALKKLGMSFVGPTVIYAHMQATGIVNDHQQGCICHSACSQP